MTVSDMRRAVVLRFSRRTRLLLVLFVALVIIKVVLAMATPPGDPVIYYIQVQSYRGRLTRATRGEGSTTLPSACGIHSQLIILASRLF